MSDERTQPLSVTDAVALAKGAVSAWPTLVVNGEVSGFRGPNARSGHCYFEVKDDGASMSVIVWRGTAQKMGFELRDGLSVQLTGKFDVYKASGKLSFVASRVEAAGEGLLRQQVAELARALEREGLMEASRKRHVPAFCSRVCVVTSLSGSVIEDVKRTLARRNPLVQIDVVGCSVQGSDAPATIIRALGVAAASRPDAVLLVRGGGSFEDLMCFNDEGLARAIAACPVPVVTGIGHEPDTTISDMVADRRASTPTAAAESVAPAIDEVERQMLQRQVRLGRAMTAALEFRRQRLDSSARLMARSVEADVSRRRVALDALGARRCLADPLSSVRDRASDLLQTEQRLHDAVPRSLSRSRDRSEQLASRLSAAGSQIARPAESTLARLAASLDALSPLSVLARGYAIARDSGGGVVKDAAELARGDEVRVLLGSGSFDATVTKVNTDRA
ncbi:exodeoxyribonuclease VII large subunit [Olsenella sp. An270]|uniref:exodeoxyribonuclease VII large subunit n=1 Tax=Olsenella sp. An270 TaxID=1965615 RepID=UPI000B374126|nr:exodeoxyribonuclease VII large subunit [Olsenella sp. An270]OUO60924.1 exodeoxyribonuclease VII large subunit [Olsenella sp. An270]